MRSQVAYCARTLAELGYSIAFVESASAGRLSYEFSKTEHSGDVLKGGLICYDVSFKQQLLGIPAGLIDTFTPESPEVTKAMAVIFARHHEVDVCVALTGLAKPGGSETPQKPVGTVFVHGVFPGIEVSRRWEFQGTPEEVIEQAVASTAQLITDTLTYKKPIDTDTR